LQNTNQVISSRGTYLIKEVLGKGGVGAVFRAEHNVMKKEYAVKVFAGRLYQSRQLAAVFARSSRYRQNGPRQYR
jgi:serine/threonine protein kinase